MAQTGGSVLAWVSPESCPESMPSYCWARLHGGAQPAQLEHVVCTTWLQLRLRTAVQVPSAAPVHRLGAGPHSSSSSTGGHTHTVPYCAQHTAQHTTHSTVAQHALQPKHMPARTAPVLLSSSSSKGPFMDVSMSTMHQFSPQVACQADRAFIVSHVWYHVRMGSVSSRWQPWRQSFQVSAVVVIPSIEALLLRQASWLQS